MVSTQTVTTFLLVVAIATQTKSDGDAEVHMDDFSSEYNEEFIRTTTVQFQVNDEGTVTLDGDLEMIKEVPQDIEILIRVFSKAGTKFSDTEDASHKEPFCDLIGKDYMPAALKSAWNLPAECPIIAGNYSIDYFQMKWNDIATMLPPASNPSRRLEYEMVSPSEGFMCKARVDFTVHPKGKPAGK